MSMDDPTTKLPDDEGKYDTKPGITAVLERISQLSERFERRNDLLEEQIALLVSVINDTRSEIADQFSKLNRKIDVLNRELLEVKAEQERHGQRIEALEQKPS